MSLFSFFKSNKKSSGIFVPDNSGFKELTDSITTKSINDISMHLGYHPDQVHSYFGNYKPENKIQCVVMEIFTKNIVYVSTLDSVLSLSKNTVNHFLRDFNLREEFKSYVTHDTLKTGIENKSLSIEFLSRILDIKNPEPNGIFNIPSLSLNLFFTNGYLSDFSSADGLNEWAKSWKEINPRFIESYQREAEHYWKSNISNVFKEINTQADAYANTPEALNNKFVDLHTSKFGNVNFVMLLVCHYERQISLPEFMEINHGRYKELPSIGNKKYQLGKFSYEFSTDGFLMDTNFNS